MAIAMPLHRYYFTVCICLRMLHTLQIQDLLFEIQEIKHGCYSHASISITESDDMPDQAYYQKGSQFFDGHSF